MFIINNNHFFGNEKHLNCEKIIILLEKLTYILPFPLHKSLFKASQINDSVYPQSIPIIFY